MENRGWQLQPIDDVMKKTIFGLVPAIASVLLSGCASHHQEMVMTTDEPVTTTRTTRTVVVTETPPPAPKVEVEGPAPDTAHEWIPGYWLHSGANWVWIAGHWEARPRVGAVWVPGHWDKDPTGTTWVWTEGHWE
jgi:hypothetical protein